MECVVAGTILALGMVALTSATWRSHALTRSIEERAAAHRAMEGMESTIRAASAGAMEDPATWSSTLVTRFQAGGEAFFDAPELTAPPASPSVGVIQVVVDETLSDSDLGVHLGMPRDLDGDGLATNTDVTNAALLLPVVLRMSWRSGQATREGQRGFYVVKM